RCRCFLPRDLPARKAVQAPAQGIKVIDNALGLAWRQVAPSGRDLQRRLRLIELPQRASKAKPSLARMAAKPFSHVERHAVQRSSQLTGQVAILALNKFDECPRAGNNGDDLVKKPLSEGCVHTPPQRSFCDTS